MLPLSLPEFQANGLIISPKLTFAVSGEAKRRWNLNLGKIKAIKCTRGQVNPPESE